MYRFCAITLLATGVVCAVGCNRLGGTKEKDPYRTFEVQRGSIVRKVRAIGTLEPEEVVDVSSQVAGQIIRFGDDPNNSATTIDFGSRVQKGTLLAQIEDRQLRARVAISQADSERAKSELDHSSLQVQHAKQELERAHRLDGVNSRVSLEQAKMKHELAEAAMKIRNAAVVQSQATLGEAEANLEDATIKSPLEGVIIDRRAQVGQTVGTTGNSLFLIAKDLSKMVIWASINEADAGNIAAGQPVRFTVAAFPGEEFDGKVESIRLNARVTGNVVTYTVVVRIDNQSGRLLPYMTADAVFEVERRDAVLYIPNAAVRWRPEKHEVAEDANLSLYESLAGGGKGDESGETKSAATEPGRRVVWVLDPDGLHVRPLAVTTGISDGFKTEVKGNELQIGTTIVIGRRQSQEELSNLLVPQSRGRD